jgi:vacuolar-type H+-ATPase subunit H
MGADLGRLLEAEQAFSARVDAARREARALVEAAQHDAQALASDSNGALGRARQALAEEEERTLETELARLDAETTARVDRLTAVDPERVAELAHQVLRALLAGGRA